MRDRALSMLIVFALVLLLPGRSWAQESTPPFEPAAPSADPVVEAVARAEAAAERAEGAVNLAANFLGIFEAIGFLVTVVGGLAAVFGVTRLFAAQRQLQRTRRKVNRELADALAAFTQQADIQREKLAALQTELQAARVAASRALAFLLLGERQFKAGDNAGALVTYEQAAALDPNNPLIYYRMGYVCVHSKRFDEAITHLNRALELDPDFPPALAAQGFTWRRMAEKIPPGSEHNESMNEAERLLIRALKLAPRLVDENGESWWGSLGGLYKRENNPEKAIYAYTQAAEVTPQSSYPFSNLALLYTQAGDLEQVRRNYQRVEKLAQAETIAEVDNYWAANDLLTARLALGKWDAAEQALALVLDTTPRGKDGLNPLESLHETLTVLSEALRRDPERADTPERFARVLSQVEQAIAARRAAGAA